MSCKDPFSENASLICSEVFGRLIKIVSQLSQFETSRITVEAGFLFGFFQPWAIQFTFPSPKGFGLGAELAR